MGDIRIIDGLVSATASASGPFAASHRRHTLPQAKGIAFERKVANALPGSTRGQWWAFTDVNGTGWCQTDVLLEGSQRVLVLESKLTWTIHGHVQLERLYRPVVEEALGKPMLGIVICKHLRTEMPAHVVVVGTLPEAIHHASHGCITVLHWLGTGMLVPSGRGQKSQGAA